MTIPIQENNTINTDDTTPTSVTRNASLFIAAFHTLINDEDIETIEDASRALYAVVAAMDTKESEETLEALQCMQTMLSTFFDVVALRSGNTKQ